MNPAVALGLIAHQLQNVGRQVFENGRGKSGWSSSGSGHPGFPGGGDPLALGEL